MTSDDLNRILLVEDDPDDRELTLDALRDAGLMNRVDWVDDGERALDYLRDRGEFAGRTTGQPVVVLLDLKMPRLGGIEVLEQIRGDPVLRHLPVVVLTSSREEQDLVRSYELGVNGFVVKPVDFDQFGQAVREIGLYWALINEPPPAPETDDEPDS